MNRIAKALLLVSLMSFPASAETGAFLASRAPAYERFIAGDRVGMGDEDVIAALELTRYIVAVMETHEAFVVASNGKSQFYCAPFGSTRGQAIDAVLRWVKRDPERAEKTSAAGAVLIALGEAAPCRKR